MTYRETHTFCRICEPSCGLIASIDAEGDVVALRPDSGHPVGGTACHKGLSFLDIHRDPDRLNWPLRRTNAKADFPGSFERAEWADALDAIADKVAQLKQAHGPNSVGIYFGNPFGVGNSAGWAAVEPLRQAIGTQMIFSAGTQDVTNKTAVAQEVYGAAGVLTIPDLARTSYLLCIGANPRVSRWTAMSHPNDDLASIEAIRAHGEKVLFVNPRRIESSGPSTGPTLHIRPGTDVYFLAALFNELKAIGAFKADLIASRAKNFSRLADHAARFTAEEVEAVTQIAPEQVRDIARDIAAASGAAVYISTGVNQSRHGALAYLLSEMINFATGNLGRTGGTFKPGALVESFVPVASMTTVKTSIGTFTLPEPLGGATLPAAAIADLIKGGDIRAMIICGGNPILTVGGEASMREAFAGLDLLVAIDIFQSATAELADYVLPSVDWLEHSDVNLLGSGLQPRPYAQYTPAVVKPRHERRNGWWILHSLTQRLGGQTPLEVLPDDHDGDSMFDAILGSKGLSIADLLARPSHTALLDALPPETFFDRCVVHPDRLIDCCPAAMVNAGLFARMDRIFAELANEGSGTLKLISMRTRTMHNSWMGNSARMRGADRRGGMLHINPGDATARGMVEGDRVVVRSAAGAIETNIVLDADLGPGVVAMTHGFGQSRAPGMRVASRNAAANCNALMPTTAQDIEPVSHMSWMTAIPVEIERARLSTRP